MKKKSRIVFIRTIALGGCLLPSLFLCPLLFADTVILKNGREIKGLVVEQHADRVILSTENGEIPVLSKGIKDIKYDEPAQNFMKIGKGYEAEGKLGEALAFYQKALEVNPDFEEAKVASAGVRNRFWSIVTEGPRNEMEKQQMIYDSWGKGLAFEDSVKKEIKKQEDLLRKGLGLELGEKGDWIILQAVDSKKPGSAAGLKKFDRLVAMDGQSLRYLTHEIIQNSMLVPRYSGFILEFERDCFLHKDEGQKINLKNIGIKLRLESSGLVIQSVKEKSPASLDAGLKSKDLLMQVNGVQTRYMPLNKVVQLIEQAEGDRIVFTVRRNALLVRP